MPTMNVDESWSLSGSHSEGKIASQQAVSCHWRCKVGKMQLRCGDGLSVLHSHRVGRLLASWCLVSALGRRQGPEGWMQRGSELVRRRLKSPDEYIASSNGVCKKRHSI